MQQTKTKEGGMFATHSYACLYVNTHVYYIDQHSQLLLSQLWPSDTKAAKFCIQLSSGLANGAPILNLNAFQQSRTHCWGWPGYPFVLYTQTPRGLCKRKSGVFVSLPSYLVTGRGERVEPWWQLLKQTYLYVTISPQLIRPEAKASDNSEQLKMLRQQKEQVFLLLTVAKTSREPSLPSFRLFTTQSTVLHSYQKIWSFSKK